MSESTFESQNSTNSNDIGFFSTETILNETQSSENNSEMKQPFLNQSQGILLSINFF